MDRSRPEGRQEPQPRLDIVSSLKRFEEVLAENGIASKADLSRYAEDKEQVLAFISKSQEALAPSMVELYQRWNEFVGKGMRTTEAQAHYLDEMQKSEGVDRRFSNVEEVGGYILYLIKRYDDAFGPYVGEYFFVTSNPQEQGFSITPVTEGLVVLGTDSRYPADTAPAKRFATLEDCLPLLEAYRDDGNMLKRRAEAMIDKASSAMQALKLET